LRKGNVIAEDVDIVAIFWFEVANAKVPFPIRRKRIRSIRVNELSAKLEHDATNKLFPEPLRKQRIDLQEVALGCKSILCWKRRRYTSEFRKLGRKWGQIED